MAMIVDLLNDDNDVVRHPPIYNLVEHLSDEQLFRRYRFNRQGINYLSDVLRDNLESLSDRGNPIPVQVSVVAPLRYLCTADRELQ